MQVSPNHMSEYHNGNHIGRYGRTLNSSQAMFVWYHDGIPSSDEKMWAMDTHVEFKISVSVDVILVADGDSHTVWSIDRDKFVENSKEIDGREQYVAKASDPFVRKVGDPTDVLNGNLWIESGNQIDEGYHVQQNEA